MDSNTLPMNRWLDASQVALIRGPIGVLGADTGWFAADVLHRLEQTSPGTAALLGASMVDQRRAVMEGLAWADDLDRVDAMRARLGAIDRARLAPWATASHAVDAFAGVLCDALAAVSGPTFNEDSRSAWHALRVHLTLMLLDTHRTRAAA